jgi:dolichol-phosphate mannosyltransferase
MLTRLAEAVVANPRFVKQFVKFAIVGSIGTVVDICILVFLKEIVGINVYVANTFSFTAAVLNNYTLNTLWTFGDQDKQHKRQLVQFFIVSIVGLGLSQVLLFVFHDILNQHYLIAKCLAILIVLFWNFTANRLWTFKE